jgi:AraC family transcriptional regulator of adaptative response / DNA-3-methyladenine glycosylase II
MRALGDPDVFLPSDIGVRRGLAALGTSGDPTTAAALATRWRPWRAYALMHIWAHAGEPAVQRAAPDLSDRDGFSEKEKSA